MRRYVIRQLDNFIRSCNWTLKRIFARHVHYRVRYRVLFVFVIVSSHEKHNLSPNLTCDVVLEPATANKFKITIFPESSVGANDSVVLCKYLNGVHQFNPKSIDYVGLGTFVLHSLNKEKDISQA